MCPADMVECTTNSFLQIIEASPILKLKIFSERYLIATSYSGSQSEHKVWIMFLILFLISTYPKVRFLISSEFRFRFRFPSKYSGVRGFVISAQIPACCTNNTLVKQSSVAIPVNLLLSFFNILSYEKKSTGRKFEILAIPWLDKITNH